jgi:hypothetical protein
MIFETPPHKFKLGQQVYFVKAKMLMYVTELMLPRRENKDTEVTPYYGLTDKINYHIDGTIYSYGDHREYISELCLASVDEAESIITKEYDELAAAWVAKVKAEKEELLNSLFN